MPTPPETPLDPASPESRRLIGLYPVIKRMVRLGIPLTRENYIACNWPDEIGEWTAEHEDDLPPPFRRPE